MLLEVLIYMVVNRFPAFTISIILFISRKPLAGYPLVGYRAKVKKYSRGTPWYIQLEVFMVIVLLSETSTTNNRY